MAHSRQALPSGALQWQQGRLRPASWPLSLWHCHSRRCLPLHCPACPRPRLLASPSPLSPPPCSRPQAGGFCLLVPVVPGVRSSRPSFPGLATLPTVAPAPVLEAVNLELWSTVESPPPIPHHHCQDLVSRGHCGLAAPAPAGPPRAHRGRKHCLQPGAWVWGGGLPGAPMHDFPASPAPVGATSPERFFGSLHGRAWGSFRGATPCTGCGRFLPLPPPPQHSSAWIRDGGGPLPARALPAARPPALPPTPVSLQQAPSLPLATDQGRSPSPASGEAKDTGQIPARPRGCGPPGLPVAPRPS